jgi:hypothetical protein
LEVASERASVRADILVAAEHDTSIELTETGGKLRLSTGDN